MDKYQTSSLFDSEETESAVSNHIISVAFNAAVDNEFDYLVPKALWPLKTGQRVQAPFGRKNKLKAGFCVKVSSLSDKAFAGNGRKRNLKKISSTIDKEPLLDDGLIELAKWISNYYATPLGQVLTAMVPAAVKKSAGTKKQTYINLSANNENLLEDIKGSKQKQIVAFLQKQNAFTTENAVEQKILLTKIGCTAAPVKKLAEKQILVISKKTTLTCPTVIPENRLMKQEKIVLNEDQQKALAHIDNCIESGKFAVTLLHGVTDSGKTEIYIRAIKKTCRKGKAAIILLPEIALTTQTIQRFSERFKNIAVMHCRLTQAQRNVQWQRIKAGKADVVIGARSAIFVPLSNLGLVIVDEEHETSYKQDTAPRYNGRDVAIKRAQLSGAHCILGSATPSLETLLNCQNKKHFSLVQLPQRVKNLPMPTMKLVDLRQEYSTQKEFSLISTQLANQLNESLSKNQQAILLLNRRGYSNFVFCPSCKHTLRCRNCDVTLTFHKTKPSGNNATPTITGKHLNHGFAICHYCLAKTLVPQKCPLCSRNMTMIGIGSQRLEEELAEKFPDARIARIDSDSMQKQSYYKLLEDFRRGRIDILAGTQMLAKGLHFPNVTVVGIISADTCLSLPDFRANERTFQLISQVAGRTGRSAKKGIVFVQTFLPDQPAIQFALKNDYHGFVNEELKHRKACNLPPFWRLAVVRMRDMDFDKLQQACKAMRQRIDGIAASYNLETLVRGPIPAVISRMHRFHRMQIIIQAANAQIMHQLIAAIRTAGSVRPAVKVAIDIDPINLL